jgi:ribonuclease HII
MTRRKFDPAEIPAFPDLRFESELWAKGCAAVAGIDEAGRGAWAGPVSAGAVIFPPRPDLASLLPKVRDSKKMRPIEREYWAVEIRRQALAWAVGFATNQEIDAVGIVPATRLAMARALEQLGMKAQHLLIDALRLPEQPLPQTILIKGDARVLSIAAASVLAKTARDAILCQLEMQYPGYGFAQHKGYGTARHSDALKQLGPCPEHRLSFAPVGRARAWD